MRIRRSYIAKVCIALVVALLTTACAELQVKKIKPGEEDGGLAYCLAVPKLQVTTKEALVYDKKIDTPPYTTAARSIKDITVSLVQVPSYKHYYSAKINSGLFTTDAYTMGYDANGCLNSYSWTTVDQAGTAITTLGSIAVSAATLFASASEEPQVTYPEPLEETYLLDRSSRELLDKAGEEIKQLLAKGNKRTDDDEKKLSELIDKANKLKVLLNPTPNRVINIEYADLRFLPEDKNDLSADNYVIDEVIKAEKQGGKYCAGIIPCEKDRQVSSFIVGIARRLR
jgi:hypothetical protein